MTIKDYTINFIRFSRLHTIIGTTLSVSALFLIAWFIAESGPFQGLGLGIALLACLGANIYIVGLNQITDIEIDKINKPYLPLASGAFSIQTGYILILSGLFIALVLAYIAGPYLFLTVLLSLTLGTAYSLPPIRLKQYHFWAAFCIIAVRGLIVNLLIFTHFYFQFSGETSLPPAIILLTATIFGYSLIIAWFKDIPDIQGDTAHEIKTLPIQWGAKRVFQIGNIFLGMLLLLLSILPFFLSLHLNPLFMGLAHGLMLITLWYQSAKTDLKDANAIRKYYLFIWILFFLEYASFVVAAWLY